MCFNAEVSLTTYLLGALFTLQMILSKNKNLKAMGWFFLVVVHIQLIEYILWNNLECNNINKISSNIGYIINHIQPIALYLGIKYVFPNNKNQKLLDTLIIVYIIMLIVISAKSFPLGCSFLSKTKSISWSWNNENNSLFYTVFVAILAGLSYYGLESPWNKISSITVIVSYILSVMIYKQDKIVGSMWCFFGASLPIIYTLIDTYSII